MSSLIQICNTNIHIQDEACCSNFFLPEKMGSIKCRTTHRMNAETFSAICKMGAGMKKKKKKGKKVSHDPNFIWWFLSRRI